MIKLVIFDCDGVVIDSESLYLDIALENCRINHYDIPIDVLKSVIGGTRDHFKEILMNYMGEGFDFDKYLNDLQDIYLSSKDKRVAPVKKGFFELIKYIKDNKISTALATSTDRNRQLSNLKRVNISEDCFDYMVFGNDITKSKPDPEIYLKVVQHYNIDKEDILVIEDSLNGVLSGINAGLKVIYIPDMIDIPKDVEELTYKKLKDLSEVINVIESINKED